VHRTHWGIGVCVPVCRFTWWREIGAGPIQILQQKIQLYPIYAILNIVVAYKFCELPKLVLTEVGEMCIPGMSVGAVR
jgi:hypothetical protein